jgi:hypothetical protein
VTVLIGFNPRNRNVQFATKVCTASIARTALSLWGKNRKHRVRNFSNACSNPALLNQFLSLINVGCVEVFLQKFSPGCQSIHVIRLLWNSKINYHIRHNPTLSSIHLIQTITFSFASTLLLSSNVWLGILSVPPPPSRFPKRILDAVLIPPIWCYVPSSSHLQWQAQRPSCPRRTRLRGFRMGLQNEVTSTPLQIFIHLLHFALQQNSAHAKVASDDLR